MEPKKVMGRLLSVLLALFFVLPNGLGKLVGLMGTDVTQLAQTYGYPVTFMQLIGALELLGGIGLLLPRTRRWAALGLMGLMLGAIASHIRAPETLGMLPLPIVTLLSLGLVLKWLPNTDEGTA